MEITNPEFYQMTLLELLIRATEPYDSLVILETYDKGAFTGKVRASILLTFLDSEMLNAYPIKLSTDNKGVLTIVLP